MPHKRVTHDKQQQSQRCNPHPPRPLRHGTEYSVHFQSAVSSFNRTKINTCYTTINGTKNGGSVASGRRVSSTMEPDCIIALFARGRRPERYCPSPVQW